MTRKSNTTKFTTILRWGVFIAILTGLFILSRIPAIQEFFAREQLQEFVQQAGVWGPLAFLCIFVAGVVIHIPGFVFIVVGVLFYGILVGGLLSYAGALLALSTVFWLTKGTVGEPIGRVKSKSVQRLVAGLEQHPVRTVIVVRILTFLMPAVSYTLAMSPLTFRDYLIGSAIGIVPTFIVVVFGTDWIMKHLL